MTTWPAGVDRTPAEARRRAPFRSSWSDTLVLLTRELRMVGAEHATIELALHESEITLDGSRPRADARPEEPGVIVSFDSDHGPLRYATDRFAHWQDNVRAVALALEALRRVDRYGVGGRGEQYRGWRQLASGDEPRDLVARGCELVNQHGGVNDALRATHPDHGGDPDDFRAVQAFRESGGQS